MHTLERQADQLRFAGVWPDAPTAPGHAPPPDLSWLADPAAPEHLGVRGPFALLVPGGSAHRPEKRWPTESYRALGESLTARGVQPVVVGGPDERALARALPEAVDLTGRTSFEHLAALGAAAALAVGNDTGPTHLIAAAGAPTLALFSGASDPSLTAPRGRAVAVLQRSDLADLQVSEVLEVLAGPTFAA
jgi:ADP-heptose:LPS heptosyltransferase